MKITRLALNIGILTASASLANAQQPVAQVSVPISVPVGSYSMSAAQVKDDLFSGTEKFAQGATDVTEINLDPKMMGMVGRGSGKGSGTGAGTGSGKNADEALARKMNFIVIHTYTYDKPGMYKTEDVDAYRKKLEDGTWSCSIHVKDKSGTTDICSRPSADHESSEMVILTAEPKELTFIHMSGRMSLDDLGKMGGNATSLHHR